MEKNRMEVAMKNWRASEQHKEKQILAEKNMDENCMLYRYCCFDGAKRKKPLAASETKNQEK